MKAGQLILLRNISARAALVVLLAFTSSCVDAVSFLGLGNVFTSAMTGNMVLLGIAIGQNHLEAEFRSGSALVAFILGAALSTLVIGKSRDGKSSPRRLALAFGIECVILVALGFWSLTANSHAYGNSIFTFIAGSAIAMGLQSVAGRRLGAPGVPTVVITTTLTLVVEGLVTRLQSLLAALSLRDQRAGKPDNAEKPSSHTALQGTVIVVYAVGALLGGLSELRWSLSAFWLPAVISVVVVAISIAQLLGSK